MKINLEESIKKINYYNYFSIINDKYIFIKENRLLKEVCFEIYKSLLDEYIYDTKSLNEMYSMIANKMDEVFKYYMDLQDKIEDMLYPLESYYFLIINISKIYHMIDLGRFFLDKWKNTCNGIIRKTFFVNEKKDYYLISDLKKEYYIYGLVDFYKLDYDLSFFENNHVYDFERYSFNSLISIPMIISGSNYTDVSKLVDYVDKTYKILLEEYEKYQKDSHEKLEKKDNDI